MKVDGTVSRLAITLSLMLLASSAAAEEPEENMANDNTLDPKSLLERFDNISLEESCNPNAESNQYIIQFKPNAMGMMESMCQFQWDQGTQDFDFATAKPMVLDAIKKMNDTLNNGVDVDTAAVPTFLSQNSLAELEKFMDEYASFCLLFKNFMCDQARSFMGTLDFMTVSTTYTEPFEVMMEVMGDFVELIERNTPVELMRTVELPGLWGLDRIDSLEDMKNGGYESPGAGNGVHVYIIDTGINSGHVQFAGRIGNGYDFVDNDPDPEDCNGHGTHCAGTALGATYGVAPAATLHGVRVLGCDGSGFSSQTIEGMNWVATNHIQPAVASMSLGGGFSTASNNAVARLYEAGVVVTSAAGNHDGDSCTRSPASAPRSFTVGSVRSTRSGSTRSGFSGYGTCVNIFAPGSMIKSAWIGSASATQTISGTSMATPHVAGAMAVYLGMYGIKTPADTIAMLDNVAAYNKIFLDGPSATGSPNKLLQITFPVSCTSLAGVADANCVVSAWTAFTTCSVLCGPGTQTRSRTIDTNKTGCGTCFEEGALSQTQTCQLSMCFQAEPTFFGLARDASIFSYKTITYMPRTVTNSASADDTVYDMTSNCAAESLPVATDDHTRITLGDDDSTLISFGSSSFPFFGVSYTQARLCSNGHIYFSGNCRPLTTAEIHFSTKRISFAAADLNPRAGGVVTSSGELLADRIIITFAAVPLWLASLPSVTAQVEMIYSGSEAGVIRMSWGHLVPTNAASLAIGLSSGRGMFTGYSSISGLDLPATCQGPTRSPTSSPTTSSPTTSSPTLPSAALPPGVVPTPGDLADLDSTPAMQFPLPATTRRRSLLQEAGEISTNRNSDLYGGGGEKGAVGTLSAGDESITMQALLQGKKFAFYPTQREDIGYTPWDYRVSCVETLGDADWMDDTGSAWTGIRLRDDDSQAIFPSNEFRFGGLAHASIFVGSNGYLTIGSRRTTTASSIFNHYSASYSQISAAFTDLNPSSGGTVRWRDNTNSATTGSFTVSFNEVPEFGRANANKKYSFQVTIHQSGKIEMSYKLVPDSATRVVVGISVGKFPRQFVNRDFTATPDATVDCASPPDLAVAIPVTMRAPTQEFSPQAGSGRRLLAVDPILYNQELAGSPEKGSDGIFSAASGGNFFDLADTTLTFAPLPSVGGEDVLGYSLACVDTGISQLPKADTSTATSIALGDDDSKNIPFTNSKTFTFFGTPYSSVWIGSNGYLTFGSADRQFQSHLFYHFLMPRISAMFTDLNPAARNSGTVHYEQTDDSFFVTFTNIRTFAGSNFFTFQIELNFDVLEPALVVQPFRISYTRFLELSTPMSARAIVGASAGRLYSSTRYQDFARWDLSTAASSCPVEGAKGIFGVQSEGESYGMQAAAASESSGAPEFCPTNSFNVSFTARAAPTVASESPGRTSPVAQSIASRPIPMVATLVVCFAALMCGMAV